MDRLHRRCSDQDEFEANPSRRASRTSRSKRRTGSTTRHGRRSCVRRCHRDRRRDSTQRPQTLYERWEGAQWNPFTVPLGLGERWSGLGETDRGLIYWVLSS